MKKISTGLLVVLLLAVVALAWLSYTPQGKRILTFVAPNKTKAHSISPALLNTVKVKGASAKNFAQQNNYNQTICFLVDVSQPSNENRFFIYNLKGDSIVNAGLVTHGRCNQQWLEGRKYSNVIGGGCTSLGRYKIGNAYHGRFGLAYKLFGLDSSNSNAYKRYVVLHAHECVPEKEVTNEICQSDCCPTVSPQFLLQLKSIINQSKKPVLLWVYN
jgi:hypothetical protein